jgi:hypothetical protein
LSQKLIEDLFDLCLFDGWFAVPILLHDEPLTVHIANRFMSELNLQPLKHVSHLRRCGIRLPRFPALMGWANVCRASGAWLTPQINS